MFKILKENIIIDIIEEPIWVTKHPKNKILILTQQQFARGVVSSDGEIIFHLEGTPKEGFEDCSTVNLVEITEEEADELKAILEGSEEELINQLQEEVLFQSVFHMDNVTLQILQLLVYLFLEQMLLLLLH